MVQVPINIGLQVPQLKLNIDFNNSEKSVIIDGQDLEFSSDGKMASLKRQVLEKLCRKIFNLDPSLYLSLNYKNKLGKLCPFPGKL